MIDYQVLATGSTGNAVLLNQAVMVDCGIPWKAVEPHAAGLRLILLTHIHGDHFKPSTVRRIAQERPLVRFGAGPWMVRPLVEAGVKPRQIDLLESGKQYDYGSFKVIPVRLTHDVPNCGYKLHWPGAKVIYATDTVNMNGIAAPNYDLYMVEANYEDEEIRQRMEDKKAAGEFIYEKRVLKTHMSKAKCDDWVYQNAGPMSEILYLHSHREEGNDNDDRAAERAV